MPNTTSGKRTCPRCGVERASQSNYCKPCGAARKRQRRRELAEANPILCVECGKPFVKYRGRVVTCSEPCRAARRIHTAGRELKSERRCENCGTEFMPFRSTVTTCSTRCFDAVRYRARKSDPAFIEQRKSYFRTYYAANSDSRKSAGAAWREQNRERHRAVSLAWYRANQERGKSNRARWVAENRDKVRDKEHRRRAQKSASAVVRFSMEEIEAKVAYWGGKCWMCGGPFEHLDHVKPLAKGGPHLLANIRPACRPCNLSKNAKWLGAHSLSMFIRQ